MHFLIFLVYIFYIISYIFGLYYLCIYQYSWFISLFPRMYFLLHIICEFSYIYGLYFLCTFLYLWSLFFCVIPYICGLYFFVYWHVFLVYILSGICCKYSYHINGFHICHKNRKKVILQEEDIQFYH